MASGSNSASTFPEAVEIQQQKIRNRQETQVQERLAAEQRQTVQLRFNDILEYSKKISPLENLDSEMITFVQDNQKAFDMEQIAARLEKSLDTWKELPLKIAVTGESGSGKSTFINTVRGLYPSDKGAAKAGTTQQTLEIKSYPHPNNRNLLLYDLPGVGTPDFPRDSYLEKVSFETFDCYIIITKDRFSDNDLWLVKQIHSKGKKFYLIRGRFDIDRENEIQDFSISFDEGKLIEEIRQNCLNHLQNENIEVTSVFVISNRLNYKDKWDFPTAIEKITRDFPENKQEAILLSLSKLSSSTEGLINKKKEILAKRIWRVSLRTVLGGICLLPGFNILINNKIISDEKDFYCKQFGLSDRTVEEHENKIMKLLKQEKSTVEMATLVSEYIALRLAVNAEKSTFSQLSIQVAKNATNSFISYKVVSVTLEEILNEYADIAKQEIRRMVEEVRHDL